MSKNEPFLGVLKVNSHFDRPAGDVASLDSWNIPVKVYVMEKSSVFEVVNTSNNYSEEFIQGWVDVAEEAINDGAVAIVTSCGFLATLHHVLQKKFPKTPIGTSSLLQIPIAERLIEPGKRIGVITFDSEFLSVKHLNAVGADPSTPIIGVPHGSSFNRLIRDCEPYDYEEHCKDLIKCAEDLLAQHSDIGGFVLECANMPPFRNCIRKATGLPVWDIVTLGNYVYEVGLARAFQ
ncbi:hypothetical protein CLIB1444_02S06216 [[Candida] jaroonii]|uniref:Uncharacterized protein n=1 Tax=[Candida] jaroonii TaxID=467808 RepID=A0ACA9Y3E6_9ASCO|nr:hypothetical protein CLIB1444_02S06216 [[Candida] jaroonii]